MGAWTGPGGSGSARASRDLAARRRPASGAVRTARGIRRVTHAKGAGESGLGRLIELHGVNTAGDAMVAVALANTLFFSVPTGEARGRVALYLLITMAPFAVMAPIIGPLLDRFRHGRRYAIATTMLARCFATWVLAGAVASGGLSLYPAAFACLVASKAYGVTRSATVPRLLPEGGTLVTVNSRISLAGIVAGTLGAALAGLLSLGGPAWSLRAAFLVFGAGIVLALRLPAKVDSTVGETPTTLSLDDTGPIPRRSSVGSAVVIALRANGALRAFSGFLLLFLAFLLRENPVGQLDDTLALGLVAGAAAIGNAMRYDDRLAAAHPLAADGDRRGPRHRHRCGAGRRVGLRRRHRAGGRVRRRASPSRSASCRWTPSSSATCRRRCGPRRSPGPRRCCSCPGWSAGRSGSCCRWTASWGWGLRPPGCMGMLVWTARSIALRRREKGQR